MSSWREMARDLREMARDLGDRLQGARMSDELRAYNARVHHARREAAERAPGQRRFELSWTEGNGWYSNDYQLDGVPREGISEVSEVVNEAELRHMFADDPRGMRRYHIRELKKRPPTVQEEFRYEAGGRSYEW